MGGGEQFLRVGPSPFFKPRRKRILFLKKPAAQFDFSFAVFKLSFPDS
jgi:hypothetical protein